MESAGSTNQNIFDNQEKHVEDETENQNKCDESNTNELGQTKSVPEANKNDGEHQQQEEEAYSENFDNKEVVAVEENVDTQIEPVDVLEEQKAGKLAQNTETKMKFQANMLEGYRSGELQKLVNGAENTEL